MQKVVSSGMKAPRRALASFTLIELLTVIAIIAILATLILAAASGLEAQGERKRAMSEIDGMSTALENYKRDNGIYPQANYLYVKGTAPNLSYDTSVAPNTDGGPYENSSSILYLALSGQTNFITTTAPTGTPYMSFTKKQIGISNATLASGGTTYAQDPWGYSYGYSTGNPSTPPQASDPVPFRGLGYYDLWSTGGWTPSSGSVNNWIVDWQ